MSACADTPEYAQAQASAMQRELVAVPTQRFLEHYLPFVPTEASMEDCLQRLISEGLVVEKCHDGLSQYSWTSYPDRPSKVASDAVTAYQPLEDIYRVLSTLTINRRQAACAYIQQPVDAQVSETPGSPQNVDTFFVPLQSGSTTEPIRPANVIVNASYQLQNNADSVNHVRSILCADIHTTKYLQSRLKVLTSVMRCMNEDLRRTHMYSMTIEDDQFIVWYWSRSHSARSHPINFVKDLKMVLRIILSLLFASEQELGLDPTVRHRFDAKRKRDCFVYKVGQRYFMTLECLSAHRPLAVAGRATRVFRAVEVESFDALTEKGPVKVLREAWLESTADTEKGIQTKLFARFDALAEELRLTGSLCPQLQAIADSEKETKESDPDATDSDLKETLVNAITTKKYKDYFLTIECDSEGGLCKSVADGVERTPFCEERAPEVPARVLYAGFSRSYHSPHLPVHEVTSLAMVLNAMIDCLAAIQLMYCIGWIHRDVSCGNLLWYGAEKRGILSDLEYAKEFNPQRSRHPDPKIGTAYFIAVEIATQSHIYIPASDIRMRPKAQEEYHQVIHHFQHDLESFFWLLLWTLLARTPGTPSSQQFELALFKRNDLNARRNVIVNPGYLDDQLCKDLLLTPYLEQLVYFCHVLRSGSVARGYKIELLASYADPLSLGSRILDACRKLAMDDDIALNVLHKDQPREEALPKDAASQPATQARRVVKKRGRDDDSYDPDNESGCSATTVKSRRQNVGVASPRRM
ncbi:hypothetical protein OE88DRAFT_1100184 [Heliocybe sulcata]|uniref:Fungal-type protein kinase domain-containing protein n=1 Tax=Heliocybe sulcata TaxID=5364 RepID=A0A5C3MKC7_9AGAM|nr:hypothetical protein OE88DRAFT_1100184 [Heliocybe sulcata]